MYYHDGDARLLRDPLARAPRGDKGPDQTLLQRHVWPWARWLAMQVCTRVDT